MERLQHEVTYLQRALREKSEAVVTSAAKVRAMQSRLAQTPPEGGGGGGGGPPLEPSALGFGAVMPPGSEERELTLRRSSQVAAAAADLERPQIVPALRISAVAASGGESAHDEFMSGESEFSDSWREAAKQQNARGQS